jgi:hypothetical protein
VTCGSCHGPTQTLSQGASAMWGAGAQWQQSHSRCSQVGQCTAGLGPLPVRQQDDMTCTRHLHRASAYAWSDDICKSAGLSGSHPCRTVDPWY